MYYVEFGGTASVPGCIRPSNDMSGTNVAYDAADRIAPMTLCPPLPNF